MSSSANLLKILSIIQDANMCLESGNGGPSRGQVHECRSMLWSAVQVIHQEMENRNIRPEVWHV